MRETTIGTSTDVLRQIKKRWGRMGARYPVLHQGEKSTLDRKPVDTDDETAWRSERKTASRVCPLAGASFRRPGQTTEPVAGVKSIPAKEI